MEHAVGLISPSQNQQLIHFLTIITNLKMHKKEETLSMALKIRGGPIQESLNLYDENPE